MKFEKAKLEHGKKLFDWRNDPETRANSFAGEPVAWEGHIAWLQRTLENPKRHLLISKDDVGNSIGTVRFDLLDNSSYEISWTVAPEWRGKGAGKEMIADALTLPFLSGKKIKALIKSDNKASQHIAEATHFSLHTEKDGVTEWWNEMS